MATSLLTQFAGDEVEDAPALEHEIGGRAAAPLRDGAGEKGGDVVHRREPPGRGKRRCLLMGASDGRTRRRQSLRLARLSQGLGATAR